MGSRKQGTLLKLFKWLAKQPRLFLLQCPSSSSPGLKILLRSCCRRWQELLTASAETGHLPAQPLPWDAWEQPLTSSTTPSVVKEKIKYAQRGCRTNTVMLLSSLLFSLQFLQPGPAVLHFEKLFCDQLPDISHLIRRLNPAIFSPLRNSWVIQGIYFSLADKIYFGSYCFSPTTLL